MCSSPKQGFSSLLGSKARAGVCFCRNCFCKGISLLCPSPPHHRLFHGGSWGLSLAGLLGLLDIYRDFVLGVGTDHFVSLVSCRAGCPRAGGSLGMPPSVSVPGRCSQCPGFKGCCHEDLTLGGTHKARVSSLGHRAPFSLLHPV